MAITCSRCGRQFDVTLFQFGHAVRCECGAWVELERGHVEGATGPDRRGEDEEKPSRDPEAGADSNAGSG